MKQNPATSKKGTAVRVKKSIEYTQFDIEMQEKFKDKSFLNLEAV